jgi:hypothetical protein
MTRSRSTFFAFSTLLGALIAVAAPAPAPAEPVPQPLEAVLTLPPEADPHGHTTPALALRPDGGFLAVWADLDTGRVIGRRVEPAPGLGTAGSELFELTGDGASRGPVALARGGEDRYLAVWKRMPAPGASADVRPLSVRAFDGRGEPLGPVVPVVAQPARSFAVAGRPGGGAVLAWWSGERDRPKLSFVLLDPRGEPTGDPRPMARLPAGGFIPGVRLAVDPEGGFLISWNYRDRTTDRSEVLGRGFTPEGEPVGPAASLVPPRPDDYRIDQDVAATGPGRYLLAWAPGEGPSLRARSILVRPFAASGAPLGPARRVDVGEEPDRRRASPMVAAGADDGAAVVAWKEAGGVAEQPLVARLIDSAGRPRSEPFGVLGQEVENLPDNGGVGAPRIDRDAAGRILFGWGISVDPAVLPSSEHVYWSSAAKRYWEVDPACGPVPATGLRTEPARPAAGEPVRLLFEGLADCAEISLVGWRRVPDGLRVDARADGMACGTLPPLPYSLPVEVDGLEAGTHRITLGIDLPGGGVCERRFELEVAGATPPGPPSTPPLPPLESPALPGFRVWVRITPQSGAAIPGRRAPTCIPETLCVAGALPDRAEVFVRIAGPKPNGFLWPTLVKLSTSTVEVWIEQIATGAVRTYRLEGATPGTDALPGLFDRDGFAPE